MSGQFTPGGETPGRRSLKSAGTTARQPALSLEWGFRARRTEAPGSAKILGAFVMERET